MSSSIIIVGDSIAQGLGVKGKSYADLLALHSGFANQCSVVNMANTAMQISESMNHLPAIIERKPSVVIVAHGVTEAIVRPNQRTLRWLPRRWRKAGWMDPRPYYSRRWMKRVVQHIESAIRWRVKVLMIRAFGGTTWVTEDDFEKELKAFVGKVVTETPAHVILVMQCSVDERFFPGSPQSLAHYGIRIRSVWRDFETTGRVHLCDPQVQMDKWDDFLADHFHPNESGHRKIACALRQTLIQIGGLSPRHGPEKFQTVV